MKRAPQEIVLADTGAIPGWVHDHASFRKWAASDEFPESGRYGWLDGILWVDVSMERSIHSLLVMRFAHVLIGISDCKQLGSYWGDRMLLSNLTANLSTEPDGTFATWSSVREGRLRVVGGDSMTGIELVGTPDMVLEIVSPSSVRKDYDELPNLYFETGIAEFWRIDPRGKEIRFDLLRRTANGYRAAREIDGWRKSAVFGASFRLKQTTNPLGEPAYQLESR